MAQGISIEPAAVFKAYVDFANSERQAIWLRNSAMLVANSFMIVGLGEAQLRPLQLTIALAGMAVCLLWSIITVVGWRHFYDVHKVITDIAGISFPFIERRYVGDVIFICTALLILVFFIIYAIATWQGHSPFCRRHKTPN